MNKYDFKLIPAYCLFNGVAIKKQQGSYIHFLLEHPEDELLKERLRKAFFEYLTGVMKISEISELYQGQGKCDFSKGTRNQIRSYATSLFAGEENKAEIKAENNTEMDENAAAVLLLDKILYEGRKKSATDIHIENNKIRFRIKGRLELYMNISGKSYRELIQRIKLLGGLNVLEKRKSQDGHFVYGGNNPLFVRVSSVNQIDEKYGSVEAVVMRLLDTKRVPLALDFLGFNHAQLSRIENFKNLKNGLVIVCGPTGSGKSTTVASILVEIDRKNKGERKIISLEDPPEYFMPDISQIKIESGRNDYKEVLNHVFRLDPDVIMIGEIRDEISAEAALKAALTGHLVFATLHTGSVAESILRLENLGLNRKILSSVIKGVICQELHYLGEGIKLYADVGTPVKNFSSKVNSEMGEEEIDNLFIHETNYSELFSKTLELFHERETQLTKYEANNSTIRKKLWVERRKSGKIYKRIV